MVVFAAPLVRAQVSATQQEIDNLSGQIQAMTETLETQRKHIDALEKEIADLRDKVNTPVVNTYADRSDLKSLAEQVQEVDRKRKEDSEMIAKRMEDFVKAASMAPPPMPTRGKTTTSTSSSDETAASSPPQRGYEYLVKQGDTLGLILKAYREKGVRVSLSQIKAANPKMNPDVLIPGKKIFIPDASAK